MKRSHYLAWKATYPDHFTNWIFYPEQLLPNRSPNYADVGCSIRIILREDGPLVDVPALDVEVFRRNSAVGCVPVLVAINHLHRIIHVRRNAPDKRNLVLDRDRIRHHQGLRVMRSSADAVDRPPPSFNPDEIVSQVVQLLLHPRLSGLADGHDADHRRNPDGDPQHRQHASHLVSKQRHQRRSKQRSVIHSSSSSPLMRIQTIYPLYLKAT